MITKSELYHYLGAKHILIALMMRIKTFRAKNWHEKTSFYSRGYRKACVEIINFMDFDVVFEMGCGQGEILKRIKAKKIFATDIDSSVAIHLPKNVQFLSNILSLPFESGSRNLFLAVNFHHSMDNIQFIQDVAKSGKFSHLILDSINEEHYKRIVTQINDSFLHMRIECDKDRDLLLCVKQ
jgi:hypothetical protein